MHGRLTDDAAQLVHDLALGVAAAEDKLVHAALERRKPGHYTADRVQPGLMGGEGLRHVRAELVFHLAKGREHLAAVGSPSSQSDPQALERVLLHVQEHADLWRSADPLILAACNVPPPPMPAPAPVPPGVIGGGPEPLPAGGGAGIPPVVPGAPPPGPQMPQMPVNPGTGERAAPPPMPSA